MRARASRTDTPLITRLALALALAACAVLAFGLAACGGDETSASGGAGAAATQTAPAGGATIEINAFQFEPKTLTVDAGTEVTVVNNDEILHTWTSGTRENPSSGSPDDTPDGMFDVKLDGRGSDTAFTFDAPGTYAYFCAIHPGTGMTGEVVVE